LKLAIAQYLAQLATLGRSVDTLAFYLKKAKHLRRVLGDDTDVHALGPEDATRYIQTRIAGGAAEGARSVNLHTISKELAALRAVLRWHGTQRRFHGRHDWCVPGELRGAYKPGERSLSRAEYQLVLEQLSLERRDYFAIFVGCGPRDKELYRIEARDVDAKLQRLHLRGTKTRRADRWIPLRPELLAILKRRLATTAHGSLFPKWGNVRRDLHAACKRAGVPGVSPNDLRRTFASWHAESGTEELVVVSLMGHSSSAMVRRVYARIGSDAQRDAAARFPSLKRTKKKARR
jgi:integrase